ncbi:MAG: hypothetical protein PHR26_02315 [Candidatus ainarchaeum sp.]|nr:hypothetical protein [Candidatus ainarchaeum sp.]MDD3976345.1 hypothetical protein [Candidatus ainarchaeum sp.]
MDLENKKRFPIKIGPKEVIDVLKNSLKKKGYKNIDIKKQAIYLKITPYLFCFYDILKNNNSFEHIRGQIAINLVNNSINEKVIELFKYAKPKIYEELNVPKTEKTNIIIKKPVIKEECAEQSIIKYLISKYLTEKNTISLSGIETIYVPNWKTELNTKEIKNIKIKLDAIEGKVNDLDKIIDRKKTNKELFSEMLEDLKDPKNIGTYTINFFKEIIFGIIWMIKKVYTNFSIIIWIIAVTLIIYVLFL